MNRYGLNVSPWMVPLLIWIGGVVPKWFPWKVVVEFVYIFPISSTASLGYPRSSIMASSLAWSIDPKAFLKSMYVRYMSLLVSLASSRAAIIIWICLVVFLCGLNPSWLKCSIWCFSP